MAKAAGERAKQLAAVDWDEVRRAYELSSETVGEIKERFGLSRYELEKRRVAENWTVRAQIARPSTGELRSGGRSIGSRAIEYRLNRLVTTGLAMLEKRLCEEGMTDQNARTLTELCRAQEIRMRSTRTRTGKARETKKHDARYDFRDDPEWLRAELNRRLDRLSQRSASAREDQGADARGGADRSGELARLGAD